MANSKGNQENQKVKSEEPKADKQVEEVKEETVEKAEKEITTTQVEAKPQEAEKAPEAEVKTEPQAQPVATQQASSNNGVLKFFCACCGCLFLFVLGLVVIFWMFGGIIGIQSWAMTLKDLIAG